MPTSSTTGALLSFILKGFSFICRFGKLLCMFKSVCWLCITITTTDVVFNRYFLLLNCIVQQSQYRHKQWETKSILRFLNNFQVLSLHFANFQLDNIKSAVFSLCETKVSSIPEPQNHLTIITISESVATNAKHDRMKNEVGPRGDEWQSLAEKAQIFLVCRDKNTRIGLHTSNVTYDHGVVSDILLNYNIIVLKAMYQSTQAYNSVMYFLRSGRVIKDCSYKKETR